MTEPAPYAISGEIVLDNVHFPVTGSVGYNNLGRFAQKATVGDYTRDSDDLQSAWIMTDFTGGFGRFNLRAGVDENRYWTGVIWGREPFSLTLPRQTLDVMGVNMDGGWPLGIISNRLYVATGTAIQRWSEEEQLLEAPAIGNLAFPPVSQYSLVRQGKGTAPIIIVPMGINGYQVFDGSAVAAVESTIHPIAFTNWDDRAWALDVDGRLWSALDPPGTDPLAWEEQAQLDGSETPMNLLVYLDRSEQWTLYVVSDRAVWAWDPLNTKLIMTHLHGVYHQDMGRGVAVWRPGEDAFIAAGLQVYDWNLASANPMGPGNPDGVPQELRGRILSLAAEINTLYAYVEGSPAPLQATPQPEAYATDTPFDDTMYSAGMGALCSLMGWTGFGWHVYWRSSHLSAVGGPAAVWIALAEGVVRVWWVCEGMFYSQQIPRDMASMRQLIEMEEGDFGQDGYLDTGWFDAGMRGFDKLGSHIEVNLDFCNPDQNEYVDVSFMVDTDGAWRSLGRANRVGRTVMPLEVEADGFSRGMRFNRIRLLLRLHSNWHRTSPLVDSILVKYLKLPLSSGAWRATVPLDYQMWGDRTADQIKLDLDAALAKTGFIKLQFGENQPPRRVRITSLDGTDDTGWSDLGRRDIAIAEVKVPFNIFKDGG